MYIITTNGQTLGHKIVGINLTAGNPQVVIESRALVPQLDPDGQLVSTWQNTLSLPAGDYGADYATAVSTIAALLIGEGQPFQGGVVVDDEEFEFAALKIDMLAKVEHRRDTNIRGGYTFNGEQYPSDWNSLTLIIGYALKAKIKTDAGQQFNLGIPNVDGVAVEHTAGQILGNADTMLTHVASQYAHAQSLRATIEDEETTTVEDLEAIDIENGWPGAGG